MYTQRTKLRNEIKTLEELRNLIEKKIEIKKSLLLNLD